ncbi:MAG: biopolymer transporter ExbD [Prevotella sp.]|nr:biopolymer transporter ExbD [Prevotella sp.]
MAKQKASKQKKMTTRVDFTPMVDMMMLLITFFMLCTTLAKPQTLELTMPSNDENQQEETKSKTKASYTITVYIAEDKSVYYVAGSVKPEEPECLQETSWGADGLRKVLINHVTEDGTRPVQDVMRAKAELDKEKEENPDKFKEDTVYQRSLSKIKAGEINGQKIQTMTVLIKPTDASAYQYLVKALDEMQICCIGKYMIAPLDEKDTKLLEARNVKYEKK